MGRLSATVELGMDPLSAPGGGEGRGEVGDSRALAAPTSPSRFAGPSLSPLWGGEGFFT